MYFEIFRSNNQWVWVLRDTKDNKKVLAHSGKHGESYTAKYRCENAVRALMDTNRNTPVEYLS